MNTDCRMGRAIQLTALLTTCIVMPISNADELPSNFLENLPPWEIYEAPPQLAPKFPHVYLDVDSKGNVYRKTVNVDENGVYELRDEIVPNSVLEELAKEYSIVLRDDESVESPAGIESEGMAVQSASSSSCPLPSDFTLVGQSDGTAFSPMSVSSTSRPAGTTTQWIVFDFYSLNYRGRLAHTPISLFWKTVLHGWGAFIGDNHLSPDGCGSNALYNSQIEGWYTIPPWSVGDPISATNQNAVFNGSNSCGSEMYDGAIIVPPMLDHLPRYRFEMQADTDFKVSYRIHEWSTLINDWVALISWKTIDDVKSGDWYTTPAPALDTTNEGIFIGSTDADSNGVWQISFSNVQCGWY